MDRSIVVASLAALVALWLPARPAAGGQLTIAAASDLQAALPPIAARFERERGERVGLTFGSSGNFFALIQNGAPFDLFFSADMEYPRQLVAAGLAEPATLYVYATGRLVLWARRDAGIDLRGGLRTTLDPRVRAVAIANPAHAPYGRAAVAALRAEGVYEQVQPKLVLGENVSQAAQFVQSGNAQVGLVALSLALAPAARESGHYVDISPALYPRLDQAAVVLRSSRRQDLARRFLAFVAKPDVVSTLQQSGFARPTTGGAP
jgi:molybdate transport system substrate-binding protein